MSKEKEVFDERQQRYKRAIEDSYDPVLGKFILLGLRVDSPDEVDIEVNYYVDSTVKDKAAPVGVIPVAIFHKGSLVACVYFRYDFDFATVFAVAIENCKLLNSFSGEIHIIDSRWETEEDLWDHTTVFPYGQEQKKDIADAIQYASEFYAKRFSERKKEVYGLKEYIIENDLICEQHKDKEPSRGAYLSIYDSMRDKSIRGMDYPNINRIAESDSLYECFKEVDSDFRPLDSDP